MIIMYHPGKVIEIFSSKDKNIDSVDNSTQVMVEMWDENLITILVEAHLNDKLKKEDVVLVDYRPNEQHIPRMVVNKVLKGPLAKTAWSIYKDHFKKRKTPQTPVLVNKVSSKQPYVG